MEKQMKPANDNMSQARQVLAEILGSDSAFLLTVQGGLELSQSLCHELALKSGWWHDPETGERKERNDGEMIALMHSELSEALEGLRKNLVDDHLCHRPMVEVELADAVIRIFDYAGARNLDVAGAIIEKLAYNQQRADHKLANRKAEGGKKF